MWPHGNDFCCETLKACLTELPNTNFAVQENGVAFLAVGYVETEKGLGWFDQALIHCPFCGIKLQDRAEIQSKVNN